MPFTRGRDISSPVSSFSSSPGVSPDIHLRICSEKKRRRDRLPRSCQTHPLAPSLDSFPIPNRPLEMILHLSNQSRAMVIGITGRQVKTTTKQMMASILISRFHTLKFPENCNDYRSIPLNIGITNVGEAHVGNLGNRLQNVVRAKQELSTACPRKAVGS
jgi:hypothetical protein